jgi:hypothetical protein
MPIMHKAALQGVKDVKAQFGKAMLSLAGVMLTFALGAAGFKTWILFAWPQTTGTVVDSVLTTNRSGDGTTACAAVESVQYVVDGQSLLLRNGERSQTKDCAQVQAGSDPADRLQQECAGIYIHESRLQSRILPGYARPGPHRDSFGNHGMGCDPESPPDAKEGRRPRLERHRAGAVET